MSVRFRETRTTGLGRIGAYGRRSQTGPHPEVKQRKRWRRFDVLQQRCDVLTDIVIARVLPKLLCALLVVFQRPRRNVLQIIGLQFHA